MTDDTIDSGSGQPISTPRSTGTQTRTGEPHASAPTAFASAMTQAFTPVGDRRQAVRRRAEIAGAAAVEPDGDRGAQAGGGGITGGLNSLFSGLFGGRRGGATVAAAMGAIKPFAAGGVIGTPTYFPLMTGGTGLAGEAGPEAIMPLARGPDGRLGVAASGGGRGGERHHPHRDAGCRQLPPLGELHHRPDRARGGARPAESLMPAAFHEILFPLDIALKSAGGPERRTDIVALGSGREERNARWAHSRRRYDAGYGVKTLDALQRGGGVLRGAARAALWLSLARPARSFLRAPGAAVSPTDQAIGSGDGATATFQLVKTYGGALRALSAADCKAGAGQRARRGRRHRGRRRARRSPAIRRPAW